MLICFLQDFSSGYLFGEILHKFWQAKVFRQVESPEISVFFCVRFCWVLLLLLLLLLLLDRFCLKSLQLLQADFEQFQNKCLWQQSNGNRQRSSSSGAESPRCGQKESVFCMRSKGCHIATSRNVARF